MAYEWPRIYKAEEYIEHQATDLVAEHVCEFFEVECVTELTKDQIDEVVEFRSDLNEYSPMQIGYSNVINQWENENDLS